MRKEREIARAVPDPRGLQADRHRVSTRCAHGSAAIAPSRRFATTAVGCTPTPTSPACDCCAARWNTGHSIGRLAGLTDAELRRLAATADASAASAVAPTQRTPLDTAALTAALQKYDGTAIDQQISRLAAVLPPLELLRDVLMPVLAQVGDEWHRGPARIAHEHLMSSTIRNILGSFLRLVRAPRRVDPVALCDHGRRAPRDRHAGRGHARRQQRFGCRVSRPRSSGARNCREREACRRTGAGAGADRDIGAESHGARTSRDRPGSPEGGRVVGGRTRRRTLRRTHQPAGTGSSRLQRIPTRTRPPRCARPVTPVAFRESFSRWHSYVSAVLTAAALTFSPHLRLLSTPPAWARSPAWCGIRRCGEASEFLSLRVVRVRQRERHATTRRDQSPATLVEPPDGLPTANGSYVAVDISADGTAYEAWRRPARMYGAFTRLAHAARSYSCKSPPSRSRRLTVCACVHGVADVRPFGGTKSRLR